MAFLNLYSRLHMNKSHFDAGLKGAQRSVAVWSKRIRSNILYAFGITGGGMLMGMALRGMSRFARDLEKNRDEMRRMGVEIDDSLIDRWKAVDVAMQKAALSLRVSVLPAFIAIVEQMMKAVHALQDFGSYYGAFSVDPSADSRTYLERVAANAREKRISMINSMLDIGARNKAQRHAAGVAAIEQNMRERSSLNLEPSPETIENVVKAVKGAQLTRASDSLAAVGGFTANADKEVKSLLQKQLNQLEGINDNTGVRLS